MAAARLLRVGLLLFLSLIMVATLAGSYAWQVGYGAGPLQTATTVLIPKQSSAATISQLLAEQGVVNNADAARLWWRVMGQAHRLQAGEYEFAAGLSLHAVGEKLASGDVVVRQITIPEGLTRYQIAALLNAEPALTGSTEPLPPEGSMLPETYQFQRGETRRSIMQRMQQAMVEAKQQLLQQYALPPEVKTLQQWVALASIVEKETGIAHERPRVAGVFLNRLRIGMPLQSDPTVIFAITGGRGDLERPLYRKDLAVDHPVNTYKYRGIPPTPIASPGLASLLAVLQPEEHGELYFVADGTGGHVFAKTLDEHNRNVAKWRQINAKQ